MSKEKYLITRLVNRKPISLNTIETIEKDGEVVFNYHETMISHIVEARENKEFEYICSEIQDFIERENIDICFVINKDELIDCLQEHKKLKIQLEEVEELNKKLAEHSQSVDKALDDSCETIRNLKKQLHTANQETLHFQNKYFAEKKIAIEELEKAKDYAKSNIKNLENEEKFVQVGATIYTCKRFIKQIDGQIKLLKGEKL